MAQTATLTHPSRPARQVHANPPANPMLESQPGPWLPLMGPLSIAIVVAAVAWISKISF